MTDRTFAFDDQLPRVPLPTLEDSSARFLQWCAPLLTDGEYEQTERAVEDLLRPDGPARTLHADLMRFDATPGVGSWLDEFWPSRYLGRRDRIALNANFFFLFRADTPLARSASAVPQAGAAEPDLSAVSDTRQVEQAAAIITAAVNYKLLLDAEEIPPIVQRGQHLSMAQNKYLFSETRIPGDPQDTVRVPYSTQWSGPSRARHIAVLFRDTIFRMDVLDPDGTPYAPGDLADGLGAVMKTVMHRPQADTAVGHLTTLARAHWAGVRPALRAEPVNATALDAIETALFCVCLEDFAPRDTQHACDQLLDGHSGNRWFDKAVSFVVFGDGTAGINVEHCGLDGTTILSFVDTMLATTVTDHARRSGARAQGTAPFEPLEFRLDEALRGEIAAAASAFADYAADNATATVSFADFGTERAKALGISPDAFAQLSYQLAHRRSKGITGATYESIATRQYRNGRTEAMRVITPQILEFVAAMDDPHVSREVRRDRARAAAQAHVARAKECQRGDAPEQHLWELQLIQRRRGAELGATEPMAFYDSPGWLITRDDYLSTSSAPSANIEYFGFGCTSAKCIGVAYVLLPDRWNIYLATPASVAAQMHEFAEQLRIAVAELQELLGGS